MAGQEEALVIDLEAAVRDARLYLVTIQDKGLYGEPDIAIAIVEAADEAAARRTADPVIDDLAANKRGRCIPHVRAIDLGRFYRLGALVRLPHDPGKEDTHD